MGGGGGGALGGFIGGVLVGVGLAPILANEGLD